MKKVAVLGCLLLLFIISCFTFVSCSIEEGKEDETDVSITNAVVAPTTMPPEENEPTIAANDAERG